MPPNPKSLPILALIESSKLDQARALLQRWLAQAPGDADANSYMALIGLRQGQLPQAAFFAKRACDARPTDPQLWINLSRILAADNKHKEALAATDKALALNPAKVEAYEVAALTLAKEGQFVEARDNCLKGLAHDPTHYALRITLANTDLDCGRVEEAITGLRKLMGEFGDDLQVAEPLCNMLNYAPDADPRAIYEAHRCYGRIVKRLRPDPLPAITGRNADPKRRLRVGLISPDFKSHSCAFFIEPLLEFHDRAAIEVYAYHTNAMADDITARLRKHAAAFRHHAVISDENLAKQIRKDEIDIAIELSGHTRGESLVAMHLRPAPIQVTYLGYPNITGLDAIDYRIVDSLTDPPQTAAFDPARRAEALIRLDPCFLCFRPPQDAPPIAPCPSDANGYITFGSCNAIQKINDRVLGLWSRILQAVPNSRLILKAFNLREESLRNDVTQRLINHGLPMDRFDVLGPIPDQRGHLEIYNTIDIALDPFPYNGTTTTCDALWMGIPVIALAGNMHASRVGVSLMYAVGEPNWIARDEDHFIAIAAQLANDHQARAHARATLREQMRRSPLCNGPLFCRRFEAALRAMWTTWCAADQGTNKGNT